MKTLKAAIAALEKAKTLKGPAQKRVVEGVIRADGWVITLGRRAAFAEGRIVDASGKQYASATSTLLVFER